MNKFLQQTEAETLATTKKRQVNNNFSLLFPALQRILDYSALVFGSAYPNISEAEQKMFMREREAVHKQRRDLINSYCKNMALPGQGQNIYPGSIGKYTHFSSKEGGMALISWFDLKHQYVHVGMIYDMCTSFEGVINHEKGAQLKVCITVNNILDQFLIL